MVQWMKERYVHSQAWYDYIYKHALGWHCEYCAYFNVVIIDF